MPARKSGFLVALGVLVAAGASASCKAPTEATFDLRTNTPCPSVSGTTISVYLDGADASLPFTSTTQCDQASGEIGTIVIAPGSQSDVVVEFVTGTNRDPSTCVEGEDGCTYERRNISFTSNSDLMIPVLMPQVCNGQLCPRDRTCIDTSAENQQVTPGGAMGTAECAPYTVTCDSQGDCSVNVTASDGGTDLTPPTSGADAGGDSSTPSEAGAPDSAADAGVLDSSAPLDATVEDSSALDSGAPSPGADAGVDASSAVDAGTDGTITDATGDGNPPVDSGSAVDSTLPPGEEGGTKDASNSEDAPSAEDGPVSGMDASDDSTSIEDAAPSEDAGAILDGSFPDGASWGITDDGGSPASVTSVGAYSLDLALFIPGHFLLLPNGSAIFDNFNGSGIQQIETSPLPPFGAGTTSYITPGPGGWHSNWVLGTSSNFYGVTSGSVLVSEPMVSDAGATTIYASVPTGTLFTQLLAMPPGPRGGSWCTAGYVNSNFDDDWEINCAPATPVDGGTFTNVFHSGYGGLAGLNATQIATDGQYFYSGATNQPSGAANSTSVIYRIPTEGTAQSPPDGGPQDGGPETLVSPFAGSIIESSPDFSSGVQLVNGQYIAAIVTQYTEAGVADSSEIDLWSTSAPSVEPFARLPAVSGQIQSFMVVHSSFVSWETTSAGDWVLVVHAGLGAGRAVYSSGTTNSEVLLGSAPSDGGQNDVVYFGTASGSYYALSYAVMPALP